MICSKNSYNGENNLHAMGVIGITDWGSVQLRKSEVRVYSGKVGNTVIVP